jgi:hypothetical protein
VVGNFFAADGSNHVDDELSAFLKLDPENPPVFVGFGSMVIEDPNSLANTIAKAAKATNTRILLQSSWSELAADEDDENGNETKKLVYCIGNCPHDWPKMVWVLE